MQRDIVCIGFGEIVAGPLFCERPWFRHRQGFGGERAKKRSEKTTVGFSSVPAEIIPKAMPKQAI